MSRRFQFSLGRLMAATALVSVGVVTFRPIVLLVQIFPSIEQMRWLGGRAILITSLSCLLIAGASFGSALALLLDPPRRTFAGLVAAGIIATFVGKLTWIMYRPF